MTTGDVHRRLPPRLCERVGEHGEHAHGVAPYVCDGLGLTDAAFAIREAKDAARAATERGLAAAKAATEDATARTSPGEGDGTGSRPGEAHGATEGEFAAAIEHHERQMRAFGIEPPARPTEDAALDAAIQAAVVNVGLHQWRDEGRPFSAHSAHEYYYDCAVCRGDIKAVMQVAVPAALGALVAGGWRPPINLTHTVWVLPESERVRLIAHHQAEIVEQFKTALLTGLDGLQRHGQFKLIDPEDVAELVVRVALEVGRA